VVAAVQRAKSKEKRTRRGREGKGNAPNGVMSKKPKTACDGSLANFACCKPLTTRFVLVLEKERKREGNTEREKQ